MAGAIGPVKSLKKKGTNVAENPIGEGGTNQWSLGGVDPATSVAIYFEISNTHAENIPMSGQHFLQIITSYQHSSGRFRVRVTTCAGPWHADPSTDAPLAASFDQETAAVVMARIAVHRTLSEEVVDIMRWLDRSLIRLCNKFASYTKDDPNSFALTPQFSFYPQFMFHLRRSPFLQVCTVPCNSKEKGGRSPALTDAMLCVTTSFLLQVFNCSPDESIYHRMIFQREDVSNSLTMIQPSLVAYVVNQEPAPVMLDATSVRADAILLLDTFFHVVVFHGETCAQWRAEGYQVK